MATMYNSNNSAPELVPRTLIQKACIGMGIAFVVIGMAGIVMPGMLGMHLSLAHNIIHLGSGSLALWCGYADDPKTSLYFAIGFGSFYAFLGIAGFVYGKPGFPGVGHMEADKNLLRIIPNALELGTMDHSVHILIGAAFLLFSYAYEKKKDVISRTVVDVQGRTLNPDLRKTSEILEANSEDLMNSESDLKDADLGRSDINRKSDYDRHSEFERRI